MLDDKLFSMDDFQISYNDTIATIGLLFDDKVKELEGHVDSGYIESLKDLKEEFKGDFKMSLDEVIRRRKA